MELTPTSILKRAILSDRVAHAYLFYGPDLSSQLEVARWLAQALNCPHFSKHNDSCGHCLSCQKIEKNVHPDVALCKPKGALRVIRIDQIRRLQEEASFKPYEGQVKVQIIQEADCLHLAAANALLKVLEEPPDQTFLILTTVQPQDLIPTVRSRCQAVQFKSELQNFSLNSFSECENDPALLEALRELSGGSLRQAQGLIQSGIWARRKMLLRSFVRGLGGSWILVFGEAQRIMEAIEEDVEALESKMMEEQEDLEDSLKKEFEEERKAFLAGERMRRASELLRLVLAWARVKSQKEESLRSWPHWVDSVEESHRFLERGANLKWVLEALLMKLKVASFD